MILHENRMVESFSMNQKLFKIVKSRRNTVQVALADGRAIEGKRGAAIVEFLKILPEWNQIPIVGAIINNELRELTFVVEKDVEAIPLNMSTSDGSKIYRRSLIFLLQTAFNELFPGKSLIIDHSIPSGGYFCQAENGFMLTIREIKMLKDLMYS